VLAGRRLYVAITGIYVLTRVVFFLLGVRFGADYLWQHFHDTDLLKDRLGETLLYTHAFTPFINLFVGLVLKLSEAHAVGIYHGIFLVLGLGFSLCLGYLLDVFRLKGWVVLLLVTLFCCSPPFIYFENFLHYEFMAAALLALAAVLFHRALAAGTWLRWSAFFLAAALIAYVRTTFHLVWLVFLVGMAILFQARRWRTILTAALLPMVLVAALYAKNRVMFGFFGSSSMVGFNLAYMTTKQMQPYERREWIDRGRFTPIAAIGLFEPPQAYAAYIDLNKRTGIPVLDRMQRHNGQANFNHWSYAELSKLRMADNRYFLAHHRARYLQTVRQGWVDYFRPTTRWHPHDAEASPHRDNRRVLGPWENFYNAALHSFPLPPFGLYALLLVAIGYTTGRALRLLWQRRLHSCLPEKLALFMAFNCLYVPALSCLVTIGELERYRFMVEAFMWVLAAAAVQALVERLAARAETPTGPSA
jgi:hypothetical protein